jgi:hypothetical protein
MSNSSGPDHELLEALAPVSKTSQFAQSYRGIALLYELLKTPQLVNQLYHSRKHICAVFNDRKSLIVVDNVPQWAHPEKLDLPSLLQTLLGDSPSIPHIFTLRYASCILFVQLDQHESEKESLTIVHEDGEISTWDWVSESWKWISAGFGKLALPARVFASSTPRKVLQVIKPTKNRFYWAEQIVESEEALKGLKEDPKAQSCALMSCEFQTRLESPVCTALAAWKQSIAGLWPAPQNGLWIRFKTSLKRPGPQLALLANITSKLLPLKTPNNIVHFMHHATTQEMVTMDSKGAISVVSIKNGSQLIQQPLSMLSFDKIAETDTFHIHQHVLLIAKLEGWEIIDLRSGVHLTSYSWPSSGFELPKLWLPLSKKDTSFGFWNKNGIWRLKSMPISHHTNILATTTTTPTNRTQSLEKGNFENDEKFENFEEAISPQMSAAMMSRDWVMPRLEAKYLLDILIGYTGIEYPTMRDTATFVMACDRIVPHLQSPIVLISILEEAHMSSYACNITRQFIDTCLARHQSGMSVVSQNEVDLRAFQLFTTFNTDTIHLLRKFVEIGSDHLSETMTPHGEDKEGGLDDDLRFREELLALPVSDCGKMELSYFYVCLNRCPEVLTSKLLEFGGFGIAELNASSSHIWPCTEEMYFKIAFLPPMHLTWPSTLNPILLREEERATHPDFYAALCFLIYQFHPQWLLPFVDSLIQREAFTPGRSMLPRRALAAIPPFEPRRPLDEVNGAQNSETVTEDAKSRQHAQEMEDLRLLARIGLLVRAQRQTSALHTLLEIYRTTNDEKFWRMILFSVDSKNEDSKSGNKSSSALIDASAIGSPLNLQKTRAELLTTLMMFCLEPANRMASKRHFEDIFSRFSPKVTAMDLTTSIRQEYARIQPRKNISVLVTDEHSQMSVSTLRAQLARLGVQ